MGANHKSVAVLDFETATSDPASADEIGVAIVSRQEQSWEVSQPVSTLVRPLSPENHNGHINGITDFADAPSLREAWHEKIVPLCKEYQVELLSSYNAAFDAPVLWNSLLGYDTSDKRVSEVLADLKAATPASDRPLMGCVFLKTGSESVIEGKLTLENITKEFGLWNNDPHSGGSDAQTAALVLATILNGDLPDRCAAAVQQNGVFQPQHVWSFHPHTGAMPHPTRLIGRPHNLLLGVAADGRTNLEVLAQLRQNK